MSKKMPYEQMKEDVSPSDPQPPTHPSMVNVHTGPGINHGNAFVPMPPQGTVLSPQGGQQMVVLKTKPMEISDSKSRVMLAMAITQLTLGILLILFNIGATTMMAAMIAYIGPGFWCGIMYILAGSFGIAGVKKQNRCMIITFMILSIISTVLTVGMIVSPALGLVFTDHFCDWDECEETSSYAWNGIFLICGITEFVISIVSSALCCGVICKSNSTYVACPVQYLNGSPQVVIGGQLGQTGMQPVVVPNQPMIIVQNQQ